MKPFTSPTPSLPPVTSDGALLSGTHPMGRCTLVGAGPGDPELLTLKAVRAIQAATVLLVDDLVGPEILALASPKARVVHVGKRGGCRSTPQAFIEKLMLMAVQEGEQVVRLKGGDPFMFGRGGEETETLRAAGVQVYIVCGITAGMASAAALGVPLTHRAHAQGVIFLTGHAQPGGGGNDWPLLASTAHAARLTLVIYMGMTHLADITDGLCAGMPPETPAAIVQRASLPTQRHTVCTLGALAATAAQQGLGSPSVIIVGDVLIGLQAAAGDSDAEPLSSAASASVNSALGARGARGALGALG